MEFNQRGVAMNWTVFVVDWDSLGPIKFVMFATAVLIISGWLEWRRG
jgi:hypothetical protein